MGKFDPKSQPLTDQDLVDLLATRGMGWQIFKLSGHRPGSRPVPHAWRWELEGRIRVMVYVGGPGHEANVEFDPLGDQDSAAELQARLASMGLLVNEAPDLTTDAGRRAFCEAAGTALAALPPAEASPAPAVPGATSFNAETPFDVERMGWASASGTLGASLSIPRADGDEGAAGTPAPLPVTPSPEPLAAAAEASQP